MVATAQPIPRRLQSTWAQQDISHEDANDFANRVYPTFRRVLESQRTFAQRAVQWQRENHSDFPLAFNHFFDPTKA